MEISKRPIRVVLVVDDDERLLALSKQTLGRDFTVLTAAAPAAARRLARDHEPDLAIVDLRLGTSSGIDLVRQLRGEFPTLRIALLSGYLSVASAAEAIRAGADHAVLKPATCRQVVRYFAAPTARPHHEGDALPTLARNEWEYIHGVLADCDGNISEAARRLGIFRSCLQRKLRKFAPKS